MRKNKSFVNRGGKKTINEKVWIKKNNMKRKDGSLVVQEQTIEKNTNYKCNINSQSKSYKALE